jgi:DNA-binding response OmpR family regulator
VDLAVVDRVLTDGDGLELIEHLNREHYYTRILVLSQLKEPPEKIKGLSSGADDYLSKPFHPAELNLRVKNLLAKEKQMSQRWLVCGKLKLDVDTGRLEINQQIKINLRRKEAEILAVLIKHRNQVVTHAQIAQKVWPGEKFYPSHTTINVYIRRIRLKMAEYKHMIETVRKFGYRLNLA